MDENKGLVYIGKIIDLQPIPNADYILSATVIAGKGGKWKGIVKKNQFDIGHHCVVYLPDALIPPSDELKFMETSNWRVKMRRFRGAPSEVLIMPIPVTNTSALMQNAIVGMDVTNLFGVTKYIKPVPSNLQGLAIGEFPSFIPKTDEPNYQKHQDFVDQLHGHSFYITEKLDGASTTVFKNNGHFGLCSRNWQLEKDPNNGYWEIALRYDLENSLPDGYALQFEACGPKIQTNSLKLKTIDGFAFSVYDIKKECYLNMYDLIKFCKDLNFPICKILESGQEFDKHTTPTLGEGKYASGEQREGVVVRSQKNLIEARKPISFKVINLNYET